MSTPKLTPAQLAFLEECYANRKNYGNGNGGQAWDKWAIRVANNLARKGLITQPPMYTHLLGAHLTDAGYEAIGKVREP